ncbi:nucleotidyltransferase family protein [Polaribacter sp.]|uniref:nucleotidyltransferase family protein n=1 Tax=Polaribacter sp. TaxID=1920175 RepID=UPI003EF3A9B0
MTSIAILVLAAGKSSRMKTIKQLLKTNNKTLLDNTLENAKKSKAIITFCVLGANAEKIKNEISTKSIPFIFNKNHASGLSSSIVAGIKFIEKEKQRFDAVLIMLADQPEVNTTYLNMLIDVYQENTSKIIASNYDTKPGVPAVFPKKYFSELKLLKGDKGAKEFLQKNRETTLLITSKKGPIDLDSPEDYQKYITSIKK